MHFPLIFWTNMWHDVTFNLTVVQLHMVEKLWFFFFLVILET